MKTVELKDMVMVNIHRIYLIELEGVGFKPRVILIYHNLPQLIQKKKNFFKLSRMWVLNQ